jgi:hypothetical protein
VNYNDFGYWVAGVEIEGMSVEMGDDVNRDFVVLNTKDALSPDVIIDSSSGHSRLVEVTGDLTSVLNTRITGGYAATSYHEGEWTTTFEIRSELGEVQFIWVGKVGSGDVEIRKC